MNSNGNIGLGSEFLPPLLQATRRARQCADKSNTDAERQLAGLDLQFIENAGRPLCVRYSPEKWFCQDSGFALHSGP